VLFAVWNNFVAPEMFDLKRAAEVIVWVIVGGKSTLVGPIVGTAIVQILKTNLGSQAVGEWLPLILGVVLMLVVLVFREGLLPGIAADRLAVPARSRRRDMSGARCCETVGLEKRFGGVHAIAGVDFTLARGELRCLIGPNGAGKSTFFKMLTGQITPTAGRIVFAAPISPHAATHEIGRLGIGIKNQVPDVFDGLPVGENLWLAARRGNAIAATRQIVAELMERLQLTRHRPSLRRRTRPWPTSVGRDRHGVGPPPQDSSCSTSRRQA
jgi:hypothetical protein